MKWQLWIFSLSLPVLLSWVIDSLVFTDANAFRWILLILVVGLPLINFILKIINLTMLNIFMKRFLVDQVYEQWQGSQLPFIHPAMTEDYDVLDYLQAVTRWPEATREQSNAASNALGNFEGIKTNGLATGFFTLKILNRVYKKYMKDSRHTWHKDKTFAGYMVDPYEDPDNLSLDKSISDIVTDMR